MIVGLGVDPASLRPSVPAPVDGEAATAAEYLLRPARTRDGTPVAVLINVSSSSELDGLDPAICDGVGLVRTEFLFEGRREPPDEETQFQAYARIVAWAAGGARRPRACWTRRVPDRSSPR